MPKPQRIEPEPGQESVWDYPRPPSLELTSRRVRVVLGGVIVADSIRAYRVMETSHPPVYYLPREDILPGAVRPAAGTSVCEWKGTASYWDVLGGDRVEKRAAWSYERPTPAFAAIAGFVAFYAGPMDACFVDGERVTPQPGGFYGGWITADVVGPFKGAPGSAGW
jgi:uncharacterized protein (DUF427 family)